MNSLMLDKAGTQLILETLISLRDTTENTIVTCPDAIAHKKELEELEDRRRLINVTIDTITTQATEWVL